MDYLAPIILRREWLRVLFFDQICVFSAWLNITQNIQYLGSVPTLRFLSTQIRLSIFRFMADETEINSLSIVGSTKDSYRRYIERDKRYKVRLRARALQPMANLEVSVTVPNISRSGCEIQCLVSLDPKLPVLLSYKAYPIVRAQIMWTKTGAYGCKFEQPIPQDILETIVRGI